MILARIAFGNLLANRWKTILVGAFLGIEDLGAGAGYALRQHGVF